MDFLIIGVVAFSASLLTFFSGFGLGTILLPAFALFVSVPAAIAGTATVHLLNNLFKGTLVRKAVDWKTVWQFGIPAIPAAILGAFVLTYLDQSSTTLAFHIGSYTFTPTLAGVVVGGILILFAILELQTWFQKITFPSKYLPLGGLATGFMGGLSGQQGALRSMFLLKSNFDAQHFIATGVFIAIQIDLARLPTYIFGLNTFSETLTQHQMALIGVGTVCAFAGAWIGARYMKKTSVTVIRYMVATLMLIIGTLMILGVVGS